MGWDNDEKSLKTFLFSKINRKITFLLLITGLITPALTILYFYELALSVIPESIPLEQSVLLQTAAVIIIVLIGVNVGFFGFLFSRSISKPIKQLYAVTKEVEKGNFNVKTDVKTGDEIEELAVAFNNTTAALARIDNERREIDSAKTEFLSITSHELRSPMTPMKAQLQMLEQEYFGKLNDKQKHSLGIVIRNADRLDKIIVDFLEISRIEAARLKFSFKQIDLVKTAEETVEFMKGFANEKEIKLELKTDKIPVIDVDPDRVSQVLRNLINNAIKFSKNKSKIEIDVNIKEDHIQFSVKDYGCGMTSEDQIRVFEPFYQVEDHSRRVHGGTGLGLAICRGIVESQKGKIWVESKLGKGSTFSFTVPLKPIMEIEPIKVLFSPRSVIEGKLKEEFKKVLGPLGLGEFNELKSKNALWKEDLFKYVATLTNLFILSDEQGQLFKNKIGMIFGDEKDIINEKTVTPMLTLLRW